MTRKYILLSVLLAGASIAALIELFCSNSNQTPSDPTESPVSTPSPQSQPTSLPAVRTESRPPLEQGVQGKVITDAGKPVSAARIWLLPGGEAEFAAALAANGRTRDPSAGILKTETDAQGNFAIPCQPRVGSQSYLLRVTASGLADMTDSFGVLPGMWNDRGYVRMRDGIVVEGTVVRNSANKEPVAGALVSILTLAMETSRVFIPGQEQGLTTTTDASGRYRFTSALAETVAIAAVAPGFAKSEQRPVHLGHLANRYDFELLAGSTKSGTVVDFAGRPVVAAWVTASVVGEVEGMKIRSVTGGDGGFELCGFSTARYELVVEHPCYSQTKLELAASATTQLQVVVHKLPSIRIQATDKSGVTLTDYTVSLRTETSSNGAHGKGPVSKLRIHTAPGEFGRIENLQLPTGRVVLQVEADGHAHAFSPAFLLELDQEPHFVTVQLGAGGGITGTVYDKNGIRCKGAFIATMPANIPESRTAMHTYFDTDTNITRTTAKTRDDGSFSLELLHPGKYFLRAGHPEHCVVTVCDVIVTEGASAQVADIHLKGGAEVSGTTHVNGVLSGWVRVMVTPIAPSDVPSSMLPSYEAFAGQNGHFKFAQRLLPGTYRLVAGRPATPDQYSPFMPGSTTQEFTVTESDTQVVLPLAVTTK